MIQVIVGNQTMRKPEFVSPDTTIRAVLDKVGIDYTHGATYLIGHREVLLTDADFDKSFSDFGITDDRCQLLNNN